MWRRCAGEQGHQADCHKCALRSLLVGLGWLGMWDSPHLQCPFVQSGVWSCIIVAAAAGRSSTISAACSTLASRDCVGSCDHWCHTDTLVSLLAACGVLCMQDGCK